MQETPDVTRFVRAYTQTHIHSGVLERRIPLPSKKKKKNQSMKNAHDSSSEKKKKKKKKKKGLYFKRMRAIQFFVVSCL